MLGSTLIDVAIGLIISFLGVSLAASAITEAISSALSWRERNLLQGIQSLLNDRAFAGLALDLYNHALVNPLTSGTAKKLQDLEHTPAYIDSRQFALAFYETLVSKAEKRSRADEATKGPGDVIAGIEDKQLKAAMECLWAASSGTVEDFKKNIAVWFDNSMDRVSGCYKKKTQVVTFAVAFAIAALANVNVLYQSAEIWSRPSVIAAIETSKLSKPLERSDETQQSAVAEPSRIATSPSGVDAAQVLQALEQAALIGWTDGPRPRDLESWWTALMSWLLVAVASLFGSAFWFDILQNVTRLKSTGNAPAKVETQKTAS